MARTDLRRYDLPSPARLLKHVLENPALVSAVRELPPAALGKLIDRIGLEDAGELVALATTAQLERIFDEDVWRSEQAGVDPRFDPARFALWLEVMLEAGEQAVVDRLCELPLDFVVLAVHRLVLVIDMDALAVELSDGRDDFDPVEKALESCLSEEWEEFRLIARDTAAWDTIFSVLMALDRNHHDLLRKIVEQCRFLSSEYIDENGGLYEVLTSDEMLEADAGAARDGRRSEAGYVAPSDSRSFLELARRGLGSAWERDPVSRAYFRELGTAPTQATAQSTAPNQPAARLMGLLAKAQVIEASNEPEVLPQSERLLDAVLAKLRESHPDAYAERLEELVYLANVLVAGWAPDDRRLRPIEALELAARVCNDGLVQALAEKRGEAEKLLLETPLDLLFRRGWKGKGPRDQGPSWKGKGPRDQGPRDQG
jgi:hypothetical protein